MESLERVRGSLLDTRRLSSFEPLACHLHPPMHAAQSTAVRPFVCVAARLARHPTADLSGM